MRKAFVKYLICPDSGEKFQLASFQMQGKHIISGLLISPSSWYPIINGIPRLLLGELKTNLLQSHQKFLKKFSTQLPKTIKSQWQQAIDSIADIDISLAHQRKTAESFAYEWQHIYQENPYEKQNFFHFLSPFLNQKDLRNKITLDIGCGSGRFTKWAARSGTKMSFGSDLGETVEVAYEMTKHLPNVCIVQADIYDMPFHSVFDIGYSIGVLHHLPAPEEGFASLPKVLKRGGKLLVWVYNRRGNARALYFYEPLRALLKNLPRPILYRICYLPAFFVQLINLITTGLEKLGARWLAKKIPFAYYRHFPFNMKLNDAFDVLATPKSNYFLAEEIKQWFKKSHLKNVRSFEHPEAGITCIGDR